MQQGRTPLCAIRSRLNPLEFGKAAKCRTPTRCSACCELPGISSLRRARNKP